MPVSRMDAKAAGSGLRSVERLLEDGDASMAAVALDLVAPAMEAVLDERQAARLRGAREAVARATGTGVHATPEPQVVFPFGRR